jgi:hypothetical protein
MSDENNITTTSADQPTQPPAPKKQGKVISRTTDKHGDKSQSLRAEITIIEGKRSITRHVNFTSHRQSIATTKGNTEAFQFYGDDAMEVSVPHFVGDYMKATKKPRETVVRKRAKRPRNENEDNHTNGNPKRGKRDKKNGGGKKGKK